MRYILIFYFMLAWTFAFLQTTGVLPTGVAVYDELDFEGMQGQAQSFAETEAVSLNPVTMVFNTFKVIASMTTFSFRISEEAGGGGVLDMVNSFLAAVFGILSWMVWLSIITKMTGMLPFFKVLIPLAALAAAPHAAYAVEKASCAVVQLEGSFNVYVSNPSQDNITLTVREGDAVVMSNSSTGEKILWTFTLQQGTYVVEISQEGAGTIHRDVYTVGSIFDSGFRDLVVEKLGVKLLAATILFAVGMVAVAVGRYAGLPIFVAAVAIVGEHEFGASWLLVLLIIPAVAFFAYAVWKGLGGEAY